MGADGDSKQPRPDPLVAWAGPWLALWRDAERLRKRWLADLTVAMDCYMRSPAFLALMRSNLAATTRASTRSPNLTLDSQPRR